MATKQIETLRVNARIDCDIYPQLYAEMLAIKKKRPRNVAGRIMALAHVGLMAEKGILPVTAGANGVEAGNTVPSQSVEEQLQPNGVSISSEEANELGAVFGDNAFGSQNN